MLLVHAIAEHPHIANFMTGDDIVKDMLTRQPSVGKGMLMRQPSAGLVQKGKRAPSAKDLGHLQNSFVSV